MNQPPPLTFNCNRDILLKPGEVTTTEDLLRTCHRFRQLKLFDSSYCHVHIQGRSISLSIFVQDKVQGMPVVFDNFVWASRAELIARLKLEIPLFMPNLPERNRLTGDIVRVLERVVNERGITADVRYDDTFWTERGMNVFYIEGVSTPVAALQIEGENAPAPEDVLKWSHFYTEENFSAARLTWVMQWVMRDLYKPRGYLRPVPGNPVVQFLGENNGTYPVRVHLPISSGDLYTFNSVTFEGPAREHAECLLSKWKLRAGDPYDDAYVQEFIFKEILSAPWAQHPKTHASYGATCEGVDEVTKRVSLTVFVQAPKRAYISGTQYFNPKCNGTVATITSTLPN
jgi:hypothetical protein